jgi:class 3 adenylate cyclase
MSVLNDNETVFLIADLSGYTALTEAHGDMSAAKVVTRYVEIVNEVLQPSAQLVERVGDEVIIVDAAAASIIQTAVGLRDAVEQEPFFPCIHAGIHAGSALIQDGHYFGIALNLTARVAAHARGGQILCTEKVTTLANDLRDIEYRSLGLTRFKNITDPVAIFEIVSGSRKPEATFVDPVCHMQVQQQTAPARLPFRDKTYYFCSFECAKAFTEQPDRYLRS